MKFVLSVFLSMFISTATVFAWGGYPPASEMNAVTIQKVKKMVTEKKLIPGPFTISTLRMNNKYLLRNSRCSYYANVIWDEFGWPSVDGVRIKLIACK